jgi:hypothetical protein
MNINELDSYNLADAVKFNKQLNPILWDNSEHLQPEVRNALLDIAEDFKEFLGVLDLSVKDITISGSNAAYTYTPHSDIDLHLLVDIPELNDDVYRELFNAKKYQYNDEHDITIGGYDVELYVQDANQPVVSQGEYSVLNNDWIQVPKRTKAQIDDVSTHSKYEDLVARIDQAVMSGEYSRMSKLLEKIRTMRKTGLAEHGEFGPENLAFKILRTQGYIKKLSDAATAARDAELSLVEQSKIHTPVKYGFRSYANEDVTSTPDGVGPSTRMFLSEEPKDLVEVIKEFVAFSQEYLELEKVPKIIIKKDPAWSERNKSFGSFDLQTGVLTISAANRHPMDILRTLAHELVHRKQAEENTLPPEAGETGSPEENDANATAGIIMREFAQLHPDYFEDDPITENASGYIPTKKQARDPRYSMALTVDIKPGEVGRQANKLGLKTNKQGLPQIANPNGLAEALMLELARYKKNNEDYSADEPPGPESPPEFPAGTVKVDVTDAYDWYKLGQHISNLKGLGNHDFGQGPPSTVLAFGSEEEEEKYIKNLKKLGLKTHDIDPPGLKGDIDENKKVINKMQAKDLVKETTLGGFPVKVLTIQDQGVDEGGVNSGRRGPNSPPDNSPVTPGRVEKTAGGIRHHADPSRYGGYKPEPEDDRLLGRQQRWRLSQAVKGVGEEASPMIKPPANRFDNKQEAFAHAREHGGKVFKSTYTDPNTGMKNTTFVVKKGQGVAEGTEKRCLQCGMKNCKCPGDSCKCKPIAGWIPGKGFKKAVEEAIKLNAPQRTIPRDELQGYADRIKTGTKTKRDKFSPIIHGSNIKAITKDDENTEWDLDDLASQITTRPRAILGTNAKMEKSKTEGEIIYDLTLPALSGIVVDEDTGDFVEITTCPGAGACQLFCYARKGGYVMFPASSMSAAQALNFLVNDPEGYSARVNQEIKAVKAKSDKAGIQLVVRWHDAGDFFSKEYLDLAYDVAKSNPDVQFYAYTKMGDVATGAAPANFTMNFSSGSKRGEEKKVEFYKQQNPGATVKQGVTVPKDMFFDLIARKGNSLIKDAKGRTQFSSPKALDTFKQRLAQQYKVSPGSIITYDQMLATPVGPAPKWNVIVQPGAGDRAANRKDVIDSYLMFH